MLFTTGFICFSFFCNIYFFILAKISLRNLHNIAEKQNTLIEYLMNVLFMLSFYSVI